MFEIYVHISKYHLHHHHHHLLELGLQLSTSLCFATIINMYNVYDVTRVTFRNRRFGGTHYLNHQAGNNQRGRNNKLIVTANVVPRSLILSTLMMAIRSFETSVGTRATWHHITEVGTPHLRHQDLKSQIFNIHRTWQ
jgi:hypothetical protein